MKLVIKFYVRNNAERQSLLIKRCSGGDGRARNVKQPKNENSMSVGFFNLRGSFIIVGGRVNQESILHVFSFVLLHCGLNSLRWGGAVLI